MTLCSFLEWSANWRQYVESEQLSQGSEWMLLFLCDAHSPSASGMRCLAPFPPSPWIRFLTSQTPLQPPLLELQIEGLILSAAVTPQPADSI